MEHILVLGATGNIGLSLIQTLSQDPTIKITAGVRQTTTAKEIFADYANVEVKKFDFLDPTTFENCLTDITKVFFIRPPTIGSA
ncbi:uncharacterized protein YbjT (DUF2867 family) [Enterococcus sp. PF1-24]|nr:uncharacterized protein YbjT (DUF2867 family) [Enterococcus sp. PFB1-1]MDH6402433.1 uncharacterized protein YbjT (DUF2867 family) [Enterococcus sp. PF1-24]